MGHDKFDTICEQNINYFTSGSSCLSVLYAIPHEGTEGHESALWMATRDWLNSICCIYFRYIWEDSPGIWGDIRILIDRPAWKSSLSVVPFSVLKDYYEDLLKSPVYFFVTLINFFGNLAMFIPIGFFPALLFRNATLKRSAIIGFGMSTFIEFAQYFIMRNTAVDDIILNTLGAICGYWVYRLLRKMFPSFSRKFICNITQAAGN